MSGGSRVLPVVHDNRKKKPPDATAGCNDREPAAGVREGEGDAGRWTEAGRGLSPPRSPGAGRDHQGRHFCPTGSAFHRRPPGDHLPRGRRLPAQRPRRSARLLPLQDTCRAKAGRDHQCHRTTVPRGPQTNTAHGNIPGPDLYRPHHPRGLHPRRQVSGNRYPTPA